MVDKPNRQDVHVSTYIYIYTELYVHVAVRILMVSFVDLMINHGILGAWEKSSHPPAPPRLRPAVFLDTWDPIAGSVAPMSPPRVKGWFRFTHSNAVIYAL